LSNHGAPQYILGTVGNPLMSRSDLSWFHNLLINNGRFIEIFTKYSFKSKQKVIKESRCDLGIVGKLSMSYI